MSPEYYFNLKTRSVSAFPKTVKGINFLVNKRCQFCCIVQPVSSRCLLCLAVIALVNGRYLQAVKISKLDSVASTSSLSSASLRSNLFHLALRVQLDLTKSFVPSVSINIAKLPCEKVN